MAKKATSKSTKKTTKSTKSPSKAASKSKAKNTTSKTNRTKATSKTASVDVAVDFKDLFYGTISAIATYVFALWAIDSGSLWIYAFMFAALYYTVHFYRLFIRNKFFNNDKSRKAKTAKS